MPDNFGITLDDTVIRGVLSELEKSVTNLQPLMAEIGVETLKLVEDEFSGSHDPYEKVWEVLHYTRVLPTPRGPGDPPLVDTKELQNSYFFTAIVNELVVGTRDPKAPTHQQGIGDVFIRLMIPTDEKGLPDKWADVFTRTTVNHLLNAVN